VAVGCPSDLKVATTNDPLGASVRLADDAELSKLLAAKSQVQSEYTPKGNGLPSFDDPPLEVAAMPFELPSVCPPHDATSVSIRAAARGEWKGVLID
jgi:hypothetical protein